MGTVPSAANASPKESMHLNGAKWNVPDFFRPDHGRYVTQIGETQAICPSTC